MHILPVIVLVMSCPLLLYAGGRMIINGIPQEDKDLWFREGLAEPSTFVMFAVPVLGLAATEGCRRFARRRADSPSYFSS